MCFKWLIVWKNGSFHHFFNLYGLLAHDWLWDDGIHGNPWEGSLQKLLHTLSLVHMIPIWNTFLFECHLLTGVATLVGVKRVVKRAMLMNIYHLKDSKWMIWGMMEGRNPGISKAEIQWSTFNNPRAWFLQKEGMHQLFTWNVFVTNLQKITAFHPSIFDCEPLNINKRMPSPLAMSGEIFQPLWQHCILESLFGGVIFGIIQRAQMMENGINLGVYPKMDGL